MKTLEGMTAPTCQQKLDHLPGDENLKMAIFYTKSIYQPKNNQYFINNAEIETATEVNLKQFGFEAIKKLYDEVRVNNLLGLIRKKWTMHSLEEDLLRVTGQFIEKDLVKVELTPLQQICRYLHCVYAPNIHGQYPLEQKPLAHLVKLSECTWLTVKYMETLMDYTVQDSEFRNRCYGKAVDENVLKKDISFALNNAKR